MNKLLCVLLFSVSVLGGDGGHYFTYEDLTVWIAREGELGYRDTVKLDHVIARRISLGVTVLTVMSYEGYKFDITIVEPKERIIKQRGN